jgi:hypothetical protein
MAEQLTETTARLTDEEENGTRESDGERERDYVRGGTARIDAEIRSEGDLGDDHIVPEAFEKGQGWWGSE